MNKVGYKMARGGNRGFTLLELLISMTILALITLLVFGALRTGIRAWEKGEKSIDGRQRERIVLDMIRRQLASIPVDTVKSDKTLFLKGTGKSIAFVSDIHLEPGGGIGIVYVKYQVEVTENDGEILSFNERNIILMIGAEADTDDFDLGFIELLRGADIGFEYLKEDTAAETLLWQEAWDAENDSGFPLAVRVTLTRRDDNVPVCVIARIAVNTD